MGQRSGIGWLRGARTGAASRAIAPLHAHAEWTRGTPKAVVLAWLDDQLRAARKHQPHAAIKVRLHRTLHGSCGWQEWVLASWTGYLWGVRDELAMAIEGLLRREGIGLTLELVRVQRGQMALFAGRFLRGRWSFTRPSTTPS